MKKILSLLLGVSSILHAQQLEVTGRGTEINRHHEVNRAMFGVHATPLTPERIANWGIESDRHITQSPERNGPRPLPHNLPHAIECQWDRYQPAIIVQHADWEKRLQDAAKKAAQRVKDSPRFLAIEFWNEPYLNWGVRPGVNYDGNFYKQEGREDGAPMTLTYEDTPLERMKWTTQTVAIHQEKGYIDYLATRFMPRGTKPGDTWKWRNIPYRAESRPWGKDTSQKTFWPGLQNVEWYLDMLKVYAPAFKEANPEATLIAGWDFHIYQNDYAAWEDVHKPTLDAAISWIDGYSEHHYGGDTRLVAASYEVAHAYTVTQHGKVIQFYNTEAGGDLDPERPGPAQPGYNTTPPHVRDRAAYTYMMRDILHLLDKSPDKAAARAAHEAHHGKGVRAAFKMLKPLRGTLMETLSPREDVWVVSALEGNRLTVIVFNDTRDSIDLPLAITAPKGSKILSVQTQRPNDAMEIETRDVANDQPIDQVSIPVTLEKRESLTVTVTLNTSPTPDFVRSLQFPAKEILQKVPADGAVSLSIPLAQNILSAATHAKVRIVQGGYKPGQHVLSVNGHPVDLRPGGMGIADVQIPLEYLQTENKITVTRKPGAPWCTVHSASLFLIQSDD